MSTSSEQNEAPKENDATGVLHKRSHGYTLGLFAVFIILWLVCAVTIMMTRGPRSPLPEWANDFSEECLARKGDTWLAESNVYAEQGYAYLLLNNSSDVPMEPWTIFREGENSQAATPEPKRELEELKPFWKRWSERFGGKSRRDAEGAASSEKNFSGHYVVEVMGDSRRSHVRPVGALFRPYGDIHPQEREGEYMVFVPEDDLVVEKGAVLFSKSNTGERRHYTRDFYRLLAYKNYYGFVEHDSNSLRKAIFFVFLAGIVLLTMGVLIFFIRHDFYDSDKEISICVICLGLHVVLILACQRISQVLGGGPSFYLFAMMPMGAAPALVSNMLGKRVGVCVALLLSALTPILVGGNSQYQLFIQATACSVVGVAVFKDVQRRVQFLLGGIWMVLAILGITFFFAVQKDLLWIWTWPTGGIFWTHISICALVNSVLIIVLMLCMPLVFEQTLGVATAFTFKELNSQTHKLLQRLQDEAAGTYEHSMAVARMASAAAKSIGADVMVTEACANFHDVGKLFNPAMFAENIMVGQENPHDSLTPLESCALLRKHVEYGKKLAKEYRLPKVILAAIEQHHGDGVMAGFYAKACKQAKAEGSPMPDIREYCYSGQHPQEPEVVLVFLCDFCEAAVRACVRAWSVPTAALIRAKVEELIQAKCSGGQLDKAALTMKQLGIVTASIVHSLCVMHHVRPEYEPMPQNDAAGAAPTVAGEKARQ